jgi:RNA polymerase sigma-70 factor (ECF subfamily)
MTLMLLDTESQAWLDALRDADPEAVARLRDLLLRAARFEVSRRRPSLPHLGGSELAEIAEEAATDATVSVLRRLDDFQGRSRFTTWAYKFALLEAAVKIRRRAWRGREVPLEPEQWTSLAPDPGEDAEQAALLEAIREGIDSALTERQRTVLVALALNGVPIDVLAEREGTTRGALYKTLHDARKKLRAYVEEEMG